VSQVEYSYKEFTFTLEQVKWALANLSTLKNGEWPREPTGSGYQDWAFKSKGTKTEASFVKPALIAAEIEIRLENAGQDGAMCKMEYIYGEDEGSIARHWHLPVWVIQRRIDRALNYCCGWKRKKMRYSGWSKQKDYRRSSQISS